MTAVQKAAGTADAQRSKQGLDVHLKYRLYFVDMTTGNSLQPFFNMQ